MNVDISELKKLTQMLEKYGHISEHTSNIENVSCGWGCNAACQGCCNAVCSNSCSVSCTNINKVPCHNSTRS